MRNNKIDKTLRNVEYYNFQNTLDKLYEKSLKGTTFKNLMELILDERNIRLAYRNIKNNHGSHTPGVDGKTMDDISSLNVDDLIKIVKDKLRNYKPKKIRRVFIPKANGKKRPLGIPCVIDKIIQQCVLQVLEPICEAKFHKKSNGFRPNRSSETAMAQCQSIIHQSKCYYVVDIDIKGFFDNIDHGKLLKQMWTLGIKDKTLLKIISIMLKAEILGEGIPIKGTPQGGIISPLLSNIVLNELDWWISNQWETIKTRREFPKYYGKNGNYSTNKNSCLRNTTKLKECYIVRYADDFKIFCKSYKHAEKLERATKMWLNERLKLEASEEKTKIVNLKKDYSEFLGFKMKVRKKIKGKNKYQYVVKCHISDKNLKRIAKELKIIIKEIQNPKDELDERRSINLYNTKVIGIHNYYKIANQISKNMNKISFRIYRLTKAKLNNRLKRTINNFKDGYIKSVYGKSKQMRFVNEMPLVPIGYVQHKIPKQLNSKVNKYTDEGRKLSHKNLECIREEVLKYVINNPVKNKSTRFNDNVLSRYTGQLGKCYVTGKELNFNIECIYKNPKAKDLDGYKNILIIDKDIKDTILSKDFNFTKAKELKKKSIDKINQIRRNYNLLEI